MLPLQHWEGGSKTELTHEGLCGSEPAHSQTDLHWEVEDLLPTQTTESEVEMTRPPPSQQSSGGLV